MMTGAQGALTLKNGFRSFSNRNYRLFWGGQLVSLAGTWMQDVALSWLVLSLTESPVALGLTMTIRFLPALLFSAFGGVLADRLPKRATIITSQSVQLAVALGLAVLTTTGLVTVALIYVLAGLRGMVDAVESPTRQAFVPEMVGKENVANAVALNSTQFNAARIVGPAIGAGVISTLGMAACFYINAASFLAVILALLAMRSGDLHPAPRAAGGSMFQRLAEGFRYARSTPEVVMVLILVGVLGTFGYNFQVVLPLVAKYLVHSGVSGLALLTTFLGIGAVAGGLVAAFRQRPGHRLLFISATAFSVLLLAVGLSPSQPVTMGLMLITGLCGVVFMTSANSRLQLIVAENMRGRVMGMYILLFLGTTPIGSLIIGQMAESLGVRTTVLTMASLCLVGIAVGASYARRTFPAVGGARTSGLGPIPAEARMRVRDGGDPLDGPSGGSRLV